MTLEAHETLRDHILSTEISRAEQHQQRTPFFFLPSRPPDPLTPRRRSACWLSTVRRAQKQFPGRMRTIIALTFLAIIALATAKSYGDQQARNSFTNESVRVDLQDADITSAIQACAQAYNMPLCIETIGQDRNKDAITAKMLIGQLKERSAGEHLSRAKEAMLQDLQKSDPNTVVDWKQDRAAIHFNGLPSSKLLVEIIRAYPDYKVTIDNGTPVIQPKNQSRLTTKIGKFDAHEMSLTDVMHGLAPLLNGAGVYFSPPNFQGPGAQQREQRLAGLQIHDLHVQDVTAAQVLTRLVEAMGKNYYWITYSFTDGKCFWTIGECRDRE